MVVRNPHDGDNRMLKKASYPIDKIHVPVKRIRTLDPDRVLELAENILEHGQTTPIRLRKDGERFVLIEGLHRLEALRALGEETIVGYLVSARLH
jgi:sulfiredoxin